MGVGSISQLDAAATFPLNGAFAGSAVPLGISATASMNHYNHHSPQTERRSLERTPLDGRAHNGLDGPTSQTTTILVRKLPINMSHESLCSMLLFAEDFVDARFVEVPDDQHLLSAYARFRTYEGANEVRNKLHGRLNFSSDAKMIVDVLENGPDHISELRRKSSEGKPTRQLSSASSRGSSANGNGIRQSSRYFQSIGGLTHAMQQHSMNENDHSGLDHQQMNAQMMMSPQSPRGTNFGDRLRKSGKSVINDDADDETGELIRDPLAYAKSGQASVNGHHSNQRPTMQRTGILTLNTIHANDVHTMAPSTTARSQMPPLGSPGSEFSPMASGIASMSPSNDYPLSPQQYRPQFPPANPADQNPPCNTLYVGNLPVDTSEDELKAMFAKQRGYKRLCFRTKHNGPMCFVEFEDVSFATKALNELYGQPLHNSIKGGIRLSFSKNPLGVRTGQSNGLGPASPLSPNGNGIGNGLGVPPGFAVASGPPPGLMQAPPGLSSPTSTNPNGSGSLTSYGSYFGPNSPPLPGNSSHHLAGAYSNGYVAGHNHNPMAGGFSDFSAGR